ncbi:MAG: peptidoglycan bridge formation glycyltransferase FemA/FemB family protein [Ignavibacteriaceae bacterium]
MEIKVLNKIDDDFRVRWENFLLDHPDGNFFQSPAYYNFYKTLPSYQPILIASIDENNNICGLLIAIIQKEKGSLKGKLSSRCIIYGGPIVKDNGKEFTDILLKELIKIASSKSVYIEFRNLFDLSKNRDVFMNTGFVYKEHYNFVIEIGSPEENLKLLDRNRRWQLNKSIKSGTVFLEANNLNEIREFYSLLKNLYKEKVKKPLPDFNFFEHFFTTPNLGKYFLVKYNNKIIGGSMCPIFKDSIYELYKFSSDKEHKHLYPGVLATWAPIEYAAKNGLKYFDFLGAGSADGDYGVREFKSKFGGELVQFGRFLRINNNLLYNFGKLGLKVWQIIK